MSSSGAPASGDGASIASSAQGEAERRQQLLDVLIAQQREKEARRKDQLRAAAEERSKNPIWERQQAWEEKKRQNLMKIMAESTTKEQGDCSFAPKINTRSRDIATQSRRVRPEGKREGEGGRGKSRGREGREAS
jgi:hypothetical protein